MHFPTSHREGPLVPAWYVSAMTSTPERVTYGTPEEARAYAAAMGFTYCEECGMVVISQPDGVPDDHECRLASE